MDITSIPIKEAKISLNTKTEAKERVPIYWFEKPDGTKFATDEEEAWNIMSGKVRIAGNIIKYKYLGCSNGKIYWEGMKELPNKMKEGQEVASEYMRELEKQESETADSNIMPRNFDGIDLGGNPTNVDLGGMRL